MREDADTKDINLAYKLEDGVKIYIPTKQEKETFVETNIDQYSNASSGIVSRNENKEAKEKAKININIATQTQLETLPGIGASIATKIISYRKEKGKFKTIEEIKEVNGIGEAKFNKIKDFIIAK